MTQDILPGVAAATYARELWRIFAPAIAGRPSVRLDPALTNAYDRRAALTPTLPPVPAAVILYDLHKRTRWLVADFDVGFGDVARLAEAEAGLFVRLIEECGGRCIVDRSPTGGRHVYVLFRTARHADSVKLVVAGLKKLYPSMDTRPMSNGKTGAIRPPGSVHRSGGHQELVTPLVDAMDALNRPNPDTVWLELIARLPPVDLPRQRSKPASGYSAACVGRWRGRKRWLDAEREKIAVTGTFDRAKHPTWTRSEARMSVVGAAFRAGWLLPEVLARVEPGGDWQGLRRLCEPRWRDPARRRQQLTYEWSEAEAYTIRGKTAHRSDTRDHEHAPRGEGAHSEYAWLREWWTAMRLAERARYDGRDGQATRLVLRALAAAAQRRGSRYISVGVRSLALACNLGRDTVARVLRELRDEDDPLIDLIEGQRGDDRADIYGLRVPVEYQRQASATPWRAGKFEAIHHAFLELGVPAAFVYEALGERNGPMRTGEVAAAAMLSRRAAGQALQALEKLGLARSEPDGWTRGSADIDRVGEQLGTVAEFDRRVEMYRDERRAYAAWLKEHVVDRAAAQEPVDEPPVDRWSVELHEPDQVPETAMELLERTLGAAVLEPT